MQTRSEALRRSAGFASAWGVGLVFLMALSGCVSVEEILEEDKYNPTPQELSVSALEKRMEAIDEQYSEPRTPAKIAYSLELAERSISANNDYAALWRGIRACAWLTQNHPDYAGREEFGKKGIRMGKRALTIRQLTVLPETSYYLALCMGAYFDHKGLPDVKSVRELRDHAEMALALDETFDHCGPHRLLGKLLVETADTPGYNLGSFREGLGHLRQAAEKCPDFAENHLFLAEALVEQGEADSARVALSKVLQSTPPADHSAEHAAWLDRASELYNEIAVDDEVRIETTSAPQDSGGAAKE